MLTDEQAEILMKAGKRMCLEEEIPELVRLVEEENWESASDQVLRVLGCIAGTAVLSEVQKKVDLEFIERQRQYIERSD